MTNPTPPTGTSDAEQRNTATAELVRTLRKDGKIGTGNAGRLLITLGAAKHIAAHPSESERNYIDEDPDTWTDETGQVWPLRDESHYRDDEGNLWHHDGGFASDTHPDPQPTLARRDWSETDVPLSYVRAAVGLTPVNTSHTTEEADR